VIASALIWFASAISSYLACKFLLPSSSRSTFALSFLTVWTACLIVPIELLAGFQLCALLPRIGIATIALAQAVILVACLAWYFGRRRVDHSDIDVQNKTNADAIPALTRQPLFLKLSAAIIAASYLLFLIDLLASFPQGSDALSYHLPVAARWLRTGSFLIPSTQAWQFSLPGNHELTMMLGLATGKQSLAAWSNWLALAVLSLSTYSLARRLTSAPAAAAIVLISLTIPMVQFQVFSGYVDLFGTAFLAAAFELFLRARNQSSPSLPLLFISALASGLTLGTKTSFLPYCAFYFLIVAWHLWRDRALHQKSILSLLSLIVIAMLLPSIFWYARSFQTFRNPIYPMDVAIHDHTLLPGYKSWQARTPPLLVYDPPGGDPSVGDRRYVRTKSEWWIYPWTEWMRDPGDPPFTYGESSGLGGAFATFVIIGVGFAMASLFKPGSMEADPTKPNSTESTLRTSSPVPRSVLLLWLTWFILWIFSMHRVLRFGLPVWLFACVLAAPAIHLLMSAFPRIFALLFVASVACTMMVSSLVPAHDLLGHIVHHNWSRAFSYSYPPIIDQLPPDSLILNDSTFYEQNFPLSGNRLTNNVVSSYEAPQFLTGKFLACNQIEYVVQILAASSASPSGAVTPPIPLEKADAAGNNVEERPFMAAFGTQFFHSTQGKKIWNIYRLTPQPATPVDCPK
jgi:hypothetical protein